MEAGKNIVTSNKALVNGFYDELIPLAKEKGLLFRCTAAVGGGICWLSELERARRAQVITKVGGIMNGTCNYILDSMTRLGLGYGEALAQAQALGYAEADPSADVDGIDTWNKTVISSNVAFGVQLDGTTVPTAGIRHISAEDVANFTAHGLVCKLIGSAAMDGGKVRAHVQPTLFGAGALEAAVPANFNLISLEGSASGRQSLYGQGAGRYPTAYNVLQDCVDLLAGKGFYAPCGEKVRACNDHRMRFYVASKAFPTELTQEVWGTAVVTKPLAVEDLHAWLKENPGVFAAAFEA
jgi:homoserine dehydrogenase